MDQRQRARIPPGLDPEDDHVLQPARHGGVVAGHPVEAPEPVEEGHPQRRDQRHIDRHQRQRQRHDRHLRQQRGRDRRAHGQAQDRAHAHPHLPRAAQADPRQRRAQAGGQRPEQERQRQPRRPERPRAGQGDGQGPQRGRMDHGESPSGTTCILVYTSGYMMQPRTDESPGPTQPRTQDPPCISSCCPATASAPRSSRPP